jgi:DNA invertase Pin-like site-specific DNA recombinase
MAVALYARVSTVRQAEADLSLPDQLNQMRAWCKNNGFSIAKEYVEPGASATDDRRPVFQQMIEDATSKPFPFEAVIVHSRSRFFRDMFGTLQYERRLKQAGATLISITQPAADDETGQLLKNLISMMDGYSSQENAKHVTRAMKENARRGFFNGSRAPFGYQVVATDIPGHKGKVRKQLAVDELEARVVRQIFDLYGSGMDGKPMGMKAIAKHLNESGVSMRGRPWRIQKLHDLLSDPTYRGEYRYNMKDSRTGLIRPESEWIRYAVEPIIDDESFEAVRRIRELRDPKAEGAAKARVSTLPTLLTGLLKCEHCGKAMTLATGKSGRYKYYKCCNKMSIGPAACDTPNLPMERLDRLILERLVDKVLNPERVTQLIKDWLRQKAQAQTSVEAKVGQLSKSLQATDDALNNLYRAIEKGVIALDSSLQLRVNQLRDQREQVLAELAIAKREKPSARNVSPKQVAYACQRLRDMLLDPTQAYGKQLLGLLVTEIRVGTNSIQMTGQTAALNKTVSEMKMGTSLEKVPSFISAWCARSDSNARPLGS